MAELPDRVLPTLLTAANTSQTILTAGGAGAYIILREITIVNELTDVVGVTMGLGTTNTDAAGKRWPFPPKKMLLPGGDSIQWGGFQVMKGHATTPDLLYALCDTANAATVTVSHLTGP